MSESLALLGMDAFLLALDGCAIALFLFYIYKHWMKGYDWLRPAIALLVLWTGDAILRVPNWYTRLLLSIGVRIDQTIVWMILGGTVKAIAYLCIIKVFSPERWGRKGWIFSFLLAALFTGLTFLVTYWENLP